MMNGNGANAMSSVKLLNNLFNKATVTTSFHDNGKILLTYVHLPPMSSLLKRTIYRREIRGESFLMLLSFLSYTGEKGVWTCHYFSKITSRK